MNKRVRIILLSIIAFLILSLTTTYGLWYVTRNQTNSNIIATKCLDISLTNEENDITLTEAYPITDEEGMKLTPYTFSVKNNCNTSIDYQLNLELLGDSESSAASSAIKVSLNDNANLLSNKEERETTVEGAYTSYQLLYGRLEANESDNHSLRLWVDENAPVSESNKVFESKISIVAGQGIENPFDEGTIAFNIVGNAGGTGYVTELSTELKDGELEPESDLDMYYSDEYYFATEYKFVPGIGYELSGDITQATIKECRNGTKNCGRYLKRSYDGEDTIYLITSLTSEKTGSSYYTYIKVKRKKASSDFVLTDENYYNLHKAEDDLGKSFYYRGNVQNNYVKFGKWSEDASEIRGYYKNSINSSYTSYKSVEECKTADSYNYLCGEFKKEEAGKDMYWRIIRVNGDGTIRLIYDGVEVVENGKPHTAVVGRTMYNKESDNVKYVGYTYENDNGTQTDSTIKSLLDTWYDANLETNYGTYIADSIFCNDRQVETTEIESVNFVASSRLKNKSPQLICKQKEDRYTMNAAYGNGYLANPVGLITADELIIAGGMVYNSNNTFYLANGWDWYWTSTPNELRSAALMWNVYDQDYITYNNVDNPGGEMRPVINLKADVSFAGEGTIDNPYEIITN